MEEGLGKGMYGKYLFDAEASEAQKWVIYLGQSEKIAAFKNFQLVFWC